MFAIQQCDLDASGRYHLLQHGSAPFCLCRTQQFEPRAAEHVYSRRSAQAAALHKIAESRARPDVDSRLFALGEPTTKHPCVAQADKIERGHSIRGNTLRYPAYEAPQSLGAKSGRHQVGQLWPPFDCRNISEEMLEQAGGLKNGRHRVVPACAELCDGECQLAHRSLRWRRLFFTGAGRKVRRPGRRPCGRRQSVRLRGVAMGAGSWVTRSMI